jgi:hypothetical protein
VASETRGECATSTSTHLLRWTRSSNGESAVRYFTHITSARQRNEIKPRQEGITCLESSKCLQRCSPKSEEQTMSLPIRTGHLPWRLLHPQFRQWRSYSKQRTKKLPPVLRSRARKSRTRMVPSGAVCRKHSIFLKLWSPVSSV